MRRRFGIRFSALLTLLVLLLQPTAAGADHPDHQHGDIEGHLPPIQENVTLVGRAGMTRPGGGSMEGRIADVFAFGNYAYLNGYLGPDCEDTGVHVVDIHDLTNPFEVTEAFIPASEGSYLGEGIQVIPMRNAFFRGDLLIHQNESCFFEPEPPVPGHAGGISLWDVSDPTDPKPVTLHTGDFTNPEGGLDPHPHDSHSMYAWTNGFTRRTYVAMVDNEERTNPDILDITDPFHPVMVNDTLDLVGLFGVDQADPPNLTQTFSHDFVVQRIGARYVMNVNNWDGGQVLLDVTDPTAGNVQLIAETDFAELDEERLARGQEISPEGNAHQSELSPDRRFLIETDEDFSPTRDVGTIDTGPFAGTTYDMLSGFFTPPLPPGTPLSGPTTFVGNACEPLAPGSGIALVEGLEGSEDCFDQIQLDNVTAAGYSAAIVFGGTLPFCEEPVFFFGEGTIPVSGVRRTTGLQLLGQPVDPASVCEQAAPPVGSPSAETTLEAIFDGWGYVRLYRTDIPRVPGRPGTITQVDTFAIPEAQDPAFASGFGSLSVHEVAMDPHRPLAYLSYYTGGFRVLRYGNDGLTEVGAFIDEGGNHFWGVEAYRRRGKTYVLASDIDFGLYIFRYTP